MGSMRYGVEPRLTGPLIITKLTFTFCKPEFAANYQLSSNSPRGVQTAFHVSTCDSTGGPRVGRKRYVAQPLDLILTILTSTYSR